MTHSFVCVCMWVSACTSDKELDPFTDALAANGAGLEGRATLHAGGVAALKHELDMVVDADGASDALLHLPVTWLQLLQQVVLLRALRVWTAVYLRLVYKWKRDHVVRLRFNPNHRLMSNTWSLETCKMYSNAQCVLPCRIFLVMVTWHLMHFFILWAHSKRNRDWKRPCEYVHACLGLPLYMLFIEPYLH